MRVLILGAGGIGGYYGARLAKAGGEVTWLVREKRLRILQEHGLRVKSPYGDVQMPAQAITSEQARPEYDIVMLAPKAYDLEDGLASLSGALAGDALLLPFLNGLTHLDLLDARYGRRRVAGGVAQIGAMLDADGRVLHLNRIHTLTVGVRHEAQRERLQRFHALASRANMDAVWSEDIEDQLWSKWAFLATLAGATTLFRGTVGAIMASTEGASLMERMFAECLSVAAAHGYPVGEEAVGKARAVLFAAGSDFTASMYRDLVSGQRTEHEHILGMMCLKAREKGLDVPLMRAAWCHMQVEASSKLAA